MGIQFWLQQKNHGLFLLHVKFLYIKINYLCAIGLNDTHELFCNFSFIWKTSNYKVSGKNVIQFLENFLSLIENFIQWLEFSSNCWKVFLFEWFFAATSKWYLMPLNFSMSLMNEKFYTQSWPFYARKLDFALHLAFWTFLLILAI